MSDNTNEPNAAGTAQEHMTGDLSWLAGNYGPPPLNKGIAQGRLDELGPFKTSDQGKVSLPFKATITQPWQDVEGKPLTEGKPAQGVIFLESDFGDENSPIAVRQQLLATLFSIAGKGWREKLMERVQQEVQARGLPGPEDGSVGAKVRWLDGLLQPFEQWRGTAVRLNIKTRNTGEGVRNNIGLLPASDGK